MKRNAAILFEKRNATIFLILIALIILAMVLISYIKGNNAVDEETIRCIAGKSKLYVSKTCSACAQQKQILGDYFALFNIIECTENIGECRENNIISIPTWIIQGKKYIGVKSLKELKRLTGC